MPPGAVVNRLEDFAVRVMLLIVLAIAGWFGLRHYGAGRYQDGYAAAVFSGKQQLDRETATNRESESDLRAQLATRDADAHKKEQEHAQAVEVAQRRVRTGTDRLRCPAGPVSVAAAPNDRPVATGSATDGKGSDLVPEVAAEVLGDGADVAGLVRRYERVVQRFEACRALNAVP
jgi:hypothetical protein